MEGAAFSPSELLKKEGMTVLSVLFRGRGPAREMVVTFDAPYSDGFRALAKMMSAGKPSSLRRVWRVVQGEPHGPEWEIAFPSPEESRLPEEGAFPTGRRMSDAEIQPSMVNVLKEVFHSEVEQRSARLKGGYSWGVAATTVIQGLRAHGIEFQLLEKDDSKKEVER